MENTTKIKQQPIPLLRQEVDRVITHTCFYVAGIGLIPIPFLDATFILGAQTMMIRDIAKIYGIPFKKQLVKSLIGSLVGSLGSIGAIKFIPGLGSMLGGVAISTVGTGMTYALGHVFRKHFAKGGTFTDFNTEDWQAVFQDYYKKRTAGNNNEHQKILDYKNVTADQLREKQLVLSQELNEIQVALDKFQIQSQKDASKTKGKRKWMFSFFAIGILSFCGWFFKDNLFSTNASKAMKEVVLESGVALKELEHSLGMDSLVVKGEGLLDSMVQYSIPNNQSEVRDTAFTK